MCGRFYVDEDTLDEMWKIVRDLEKKQLPKQTRDIRPSESAYVLTGEEKDIFAARMEWGFPQRDRKGLLINARAESVLDRPMFRESVKRRRCVIPAAGYYEWDWAKNKVTFTGKHQSVLYMAGFYNLIDGKERFVSLTTEANESVHQVHQRMPVIMGQESIRSYLFDQDAWPFLLKKIPPELLSAQEYQQVSILEFNRK